MDSDGDLKVSFGQRSYLYSPSCCLPAPPGSVVDDLGQHGSGQTPDNNSMESFLGHSSCERIHTVIVVLQSSSSSVPL